MITVLDARRVELAGYKAQVEIVRRVPLTRWETDRLDILAFGELRRLEKASARRRELPRLAARVRRLREQSLIASLGGADASTVPWQGVIAYEGTATGDGRLIQPGALSWGALPAPLRWAAQDFGSHDGAVAVGRIDQIERRDGGAIWATGLLDLGSPAGQELARQIDGGFAGGCSIDIDSATTAPSTSGDGAEAAVVTAGRIRGLTVVSVPAFDGAQIALVGQSGADLAPGLYSAATDPHADGEDCGCAELSTAGAATFTTTTPPTGTRRAAQHRGSTT